MALIRAFLTSLLLLVASPASAQLTATYVGVAGDFQMRIEISPTGELRGTMPGTPMEFMTIGGVGYMIDSSDGTPKVYRVTDLTTVMAESFSEIGKDVPAEFGTPPKGLPNMVLDEGETVTINGRTGKAYYFHPAGAERSERPAVVISDDLALAPLGVVMARQFEMSMAMMPPMMAPYFEQQMKPMMDALHRGAPLQFGPVQLRDISTAPIAPERFVLPAPPLTLDEARARMKANGGYLP